MALLASDESADSPAPETTQPNPESATPAQPAPEPAKTTEVPTPETNPEGTPATAPEAKPAAKAPSKYDKAVGRQAEAWEQIDREKADVRSTRKQLDEAREAFKAEQAAFEAEKAKSNQPKYKPEDYEAFADKCELEGKTDLADAARKHAKELRDNPPKPLPTNAEQEEKFKALQKEWWGKAAIDFPAVAKKDSPEAVKLAELVKTEPAIVNDPKGMYYAARLVTAEVAAARVPTMEKELGAASAKIKALEEKLQVPSDGIVSGAPKGDVPFAQRSEDEQLSELERDAKALSPSF